MMRISPWLVVVSVGLGLVLPRLASAERLVYNPVTKRSEPDRNPRPVRFPQMKPAPAPPAAPVTSESVSDASGVQPANYAAPCDCDSAGCSSGDWAPAGCGDVACGDGVCGDVVCGDLVDCSTWGCRSYASFEATFLQPRFERNIAYTLQEGDGAGTESTTQREFEYDLAFAPRVILGWEHERGVGFQATWWQFDETADSLSANPPANGFGSVSPPPFGEVDIATNVPANRLTATSGLKAYTIDLEVTKTRCFSCWTLGVAGGLRYAQVEQNYSAETRNATSVALGRIDYRHELRGIGPTIALGASTPLGYCLELFGKARGSLLFGDGSSRLTAGEDLDLTNSFTTTNVTNRDDLLPIAEVQLGLAWRAAACPRRIWRPFATVAIEGQSWGGAGNASSEDGNLGFFGLATSLGTTW